MWLVVFKGIYHPCVYAWEIILSYVYVNSGFYKSGDKNEHTISLKDSKNNVWLKGWQPLFWLWILEQQQIPFLAFSKNNS